MLLQGMVEHWDKHGTKLLDLTSLHSAVANSLSLPSCFLSFSLLPTFPNPYFSHSPLGCFLYPALSLGSVWLRPKGLVYGVGRGLGRLEGLLE